MASSPARSAGEGTSVSSVAGASPSTGLLGIPPAASRGPVLTGISDLGCWLRPPRLPLIPPPKTPRCPRPAAPAVSAAPLPPRPAGIHGVRPPRGGPQVIAPSRADLLVPTASTATFGPVAAAVVSVTAGPHWWRGLGFPAPASARPASLSARWRSPQPLRREMAADVLALVATALAAASPGGVPGRQVPALLQAASVLAGRGASSRERRKRQRQSREPVYHSPPGRVPACLRPRHQQRFRRTQRQAAPSLRSGVVAVASLPQPRPQQPQPSPAVTGMQPTPVPFDTPPRSHPPPQVAAVQAVAPQPARLSRSQRRQQSRQRTLPTPSQPFVSPPAPSSSPQPQQLRQSPPAAPHPRPQQHQQPPPNQFPLPQPQLHQPPAPQVQPFPPIPRAPRAAAAPVAATPLHIEQHVMHVGTCLTLLSYVLDQLHMCLARQSLAVGGMVPSEQSAAVAAATEMLHYLPLIGLVPGAPGAALGPGPGAMMRLAESTQQAPLGLVSAAASVLRWMDGRLCWILAE
ncbi:unnamed protein product [Closterium sp. NIES-65]|nr:unnamed protein product [Closterium sp. NIES-65]